MGWIVGGACALVLLLINLILPVNIAIIISMLMGVLLTGSFHEDGLADTCDGFGGGWEKQQKLSIMKDSRLGTYGAMALWFVLTIKYVLLMELAELAELEILHPNIVIIGLLIAHPLSRSISTSMIYCLPYVTDEEQSKVKPLAEKQFLSDFSISLIIGGIGLFFISNVITIIISLLVTFILLRLLFIKQIGGFTGDTLGATQQISELIIYAAILVGVSL